MVEESTYPPGKLLGVRARADEEIWVFHRTVLRSNLSHERPDCFYFLVIQLKSLHILLLYPATN
jgi:hypothetical protein